MESSLSSIVSNIYMEYLEKLALTLAQHKPSLWLCYVDDTFVVWPHGPEQLQNFLSHLNSLRPTIQFTMEIRVRQWDFFFGWRGERGEGESRNSQHPG
jgi:hypothetical protein